MEDHQAEINKQGSRGLLHVLDAYRFSMLGFRAAIRHEISFRLELILGIVLFPLALWLGESAIERVLLLVPLFLVLIVELLNSAIETAIDRISTEHHPLSGRAKDIGSAACFLAQMSVLLIWGTILIDKL